MVGIIRGILFFCLIVLLLAIISLSIVAPEFKQFINALVIVELLIMTYLGWIYKKEVISFLRTKFFVRMINNTIRV